MENKTASCYHYELFLSCYTRPTQGRRVGSPGQGTPSLPPEDSVTWTGYLLKYCHRLPLLDRVAWAGSVGDFYAPWDIMKID